MYRVEFYETIDGKSPAMQFLNSLDVKMRAKVDGLIAFLEEYGPSLRLPYSKSLGDGIFELRAEQGGNITRVLYFFAIGERIVLTHGFVKKTRRTPPVEIGRAKRIREDWRSRHGLFR